MASAFKSADWILLSYNAEQENANVFYNVEVNSSSKVNATLLLSSAYPQNVSVPYTVTGSATAGTDHNLSSGTAVIAAGNLSINLPIRIFGDNLTEGNETVIVSIGTPTNAKLGVDTPVHTVTIIDDPNVAPVANNDSINVTSITTPIQLNVLSNDTDANGDALSIQSYTNPTAGTLVKTGKVFTYTPNVDFPATDSFTYVVSDKRGGTANGTVTLNYQIPFTWTGAGGNANWNTTANWLGGSVPGAGNTAYFNDGCGANCNPAMNVAVSVAGVRINSSYAGTITQSSGMTLTVGSGGWLQRAATFNGGDSQITFNAGSLIMTGASAFNATSANTFFNETQGASFVLLDIAAASTLSFPNTSSQSIYIQANCGSPNYQIISPQKLSFYNLTMTTGGTGCGAAYFGNSAQPIEVRGSITQGSAGQGINFIGTYEVYGNFVMTGSSSIDSTWKSMGALNSVFSGAGTLGHLVVNKSGGASLTPDVGVTVFSVGGITIQTGAFTFPATLNIAKTVTGYTEAFKIAAGTTVTTPTNSTVNMDIRGACGGPIYYVDVDTTYNFENLIMSGSNTGCGGATVLLGAGDTITIKKDFTLSGGFNANFSPTLEGSLLQGGSAPGGNLALTYATTNNKTAAASLGFSSGSWNIDKTGGQVQLSANALLNAASQTLTITNGTLDLNTKTLTIGSTLTIASGGKLICNGGTVSASSYVVNGEVSCGAAIGITWTGATGDHLWATAGNWTNNNVPGASDIALFNGKCAAANCDVNIPSGLSVKGFRIESSYTGTITQPSGISFTVGTGGWIQNGGTFAGGNSAITFTQYMKLTGGTFTATSGTLTLGLSNSCSTVRSLDYTAGTFNHNNGRFKVIQGRSGGGSCHATSELNYIASFTVYDLEFNVPATSGGWYSYLNYINASKITVARNYYNYGHMVNLSVDVSGDLYLNKNNGTGSGIINLVGTGSQNFNYTNASTASEIIKINKTAGTVQAGSGTNLAAYALELNQGTFIAPTGTLTLGIPTGTGGVFNILLIAAGTTFNTNSGLISFSHYRVGANHTNPNINVPVGFEFNNVELTAPATAGGWYDYITSTTSPLVVNGNFDFKGKVNNANWNVKGNITISANATGGNSLIKAIGNTDQTITGGGTALVFPNLEIASTGGTVFLSGILSIYGNYNYTSGIVDAGTSTMYFSPPNSGSSSYVVGPVSYNNVTFAGNSASHNLNSGTLTVLGTLTLADSNGTAGSINSGTINLAGNLSLLSTGKIGSANIRMVGNTNQTITGVSSAWVPALEIASTGGTVTLAGSILFKFSYTVTSGTVDPGTSTLLFTGIPSTTHTHVFGAWNYNNITFGGNVTGHNLSSGTLNVLGTLTFTDVNGTAGSVNSGTINASGNVAFSSYGKVGSAVLNYIGTTTTTLTLGSMAKLLGTTQIIAKTGAGQVNLASDANYTVGGQSFTLTSGTLNLAGWDFNVNNILTIGASGILQCSGGDFTAGTLTNSGTISCPGYSGYPFNWVGTAADGLWNSPSNWQGGIVPTTTDVVVFNDTFCGANCSVTTNVAVSIKGMDMQSGYTGTVTQGTGNTITLGTKGWKQAGGAFVGANTNITSSGQVSISGGSYTATSATTSVSGNVSLGAGITYNHGSGKLLITGGTKTYSLGGKRFYDVDLIPTSGSQTFSSTMYVDRDLYVSDDYSGASGTIEVKRNLSLGSWGFDSSGAAVLIRLTGSANQSIATTGGSLSGIEFASTGGTITFPAAISVFGNILYTSGTVDFTGSTISYFPATGSRSINAPTLDFNHFIFKSGSGGATINIAGGMLVQGNLSVEDDTGGITGTINAYKDIAIYSWGFDTSGVNATVVAAGTADATLSVTGGTPVISKIKVSKSGGAVLNLGTAISIASPRDLVVDAGAILNMNGYNLTTTGTTINNGIIHRGPGACGTFSAGTLTGNAAVCP